MLLRVSLVCLLVTLGDAVDASSSLLTGELGRWLDTTAAPELVDVLSKHPRFKGETIRFVSMREGKPTDNSDRLTLAIQRFLTQRLLRDGNIRLAWSNHHPSCRVPRKIPYLLGIEVSRRGTREHRVNIAMVDVQEAVWVSGIGLSWAGRFTNDERHALDVPVNEAYRGSITSPLPVRDTAAVVGILKERMGCSLKGGLEGTVYVSSSEIHELTGLIHALENELTITPIAILTNNQSKADWLMVANVEPVGNGSFELIILLQPSGEAAGETTQNAQRVASVFVTGLAMTQNETTPAKPPAPIIAHPTEPPTQHNLLTTLSMQASSRSGICDVGRTRTPACVEVGFELLEPAYLLVFRTDGSKLTPTSCNRRIPESKPGPRRYRLRVSPTTRPANRPDAGIYVLATKNQAIAVAFSRHLRSAPEACEGLNRGSLESWVERFQ
ncbi:MAG: hypothetical protein O7E57_14955, partial [Gammaproteobacteria bacterium]|nr:hypothetical protein [Gammaproteobacteria bacterium]